MSNDVILNKSKWTTDNLECIRVADTIRIINNITRIIIHIILTTHNIITSHTIRTIHTANNTADIKRSYKVLDSGLFF
jgi:hypothetical protein